MFLSLFGHAAKGTDLAFWIEGEVIPGIKLASGWAKGLAFDLGGEAGRGGLRCGPFSPNSQTVRRQECGAKSCAGMLRRYPPRPDVHNVHCLEFGVAPAAPEPVSTGTGVGL